MALMLQALSQRVALWLGWHTLPVIMLTIGYFLWKPVMADPSPNQLVGLGIYSAFCLAILYATGRSRA